jgi:hypothetical protein
MSKRAKKRTFNEGDRLPPIRSESVYVCEFFSQWGNGWALVKTEYMDGISRAEAVSKVADWCEGKEHHRRARLYKATVTPTKQQPTKGAKKK